MKILDLCCGGGGCSAGYERAGFDVLGVDIEPQPRYPYDFIQADLFDVLKGWNFFKDGIDAIHVSPPCGGYTQGKNINNGNHPRLIPQIRTLLLRTGKPYIIENVVGAPLRSPLFLCGAMFDGLRVYRHRIFETNFQVSQPEHPDHIHPVCKVGRRPQNGEWIQLVGNFTGVDEARLATGLTWLGTKELKEAIPPAYTNHIGEFLKIHLGTEK